MSSSFIYRFLICASLLLSIQIFSEASTWNKNRKISFSITENDTTTYVLHLALNEEGTPQYFYRNIFTPVCITGECKPVYIDFYWDLLGNYTHYRMPDGEILTKMDHDEFTDADYDKLQSILSNASSVLKDVEMKDLISTGTENLADSVDAKTGATLKSIKNEVIDGAVYTCYTLWHIAYGKVVTSKMKAVTDSLQNDLLLHTFLQSANHHYQYWAMGRESKSETGEPMVPEKADNFTLGTSNLWASVAKHTLSSFPALPWALQFSNEYHIDQFKSDWQWETGFGRLNTITQAEEIRDHNLRAVFGNWSYLKNNK